MLCQVYHNGSIIPARVKRGESFATVSYQGATYEKTEFVYLCKNNNNVKFVPCNANYVAAQAIVCGRTETNEPLYFGRVHCQNQHIPGKFQPSLRGLLFVCNGEEKKALHFEILVQNTFVQDIFEFSSETTGSFDSDDF